MADRDRGYAIAVATEVDLKAILRDPRKADVREWEKAGGNKSFQQMLDEAVRRPEARAVRKLYGEGAPFLTLALFGVFPFGTFQGEPRGLGWMVLSNAALRHLRPLSRLWRRTRDELHRDFYTIDAWADDENTLHKRWLEKVGFEYVTTLPLWAAQHKYSLYRSKRD